MKAFLLTLLALLIGWTLGTKFRSAPANVSASSISKTEIPHAPEPAWNKALSDLLAAQDSDSMEEFCAEQLSVSEIPAALRRLGPFASPSALEILFVRWASVAPTEAMKFYQSFGIPEQAGEGIGSSILTTWAEKDLPTAAAFAEREIDAAETILAREKLWTTLAKMDGTAAFEKGRTSLVGMEEIFTEWVKQDWNAAASALEKLPPGVRLEQASYAVLDQAMKKDPQAALAWFRTLPDSIRAAVGMYQLLGRYTDVPREVKFSLLGEQLLGFGHNDDVSSAMRRVQKADESTRGTAITELSKSLGGRVGGELHKWAKEDANGALRWAAQFPDATLRPVLMGQFGQQMITDGNVSGGLQAMQSLPPQTQEALLQAAAKDARAETIETTAAQLPEGPLRNAFLQGAK